MQLVAVTMRLWVLLISILTLTSTSHGKSTEGFISIDCGLDGDSNYRQTYTGIIYSPDALYIDSGENRRMSPETNVTGRFEYYKTLRSFPNGTRNCYTLRPLVKGRKYLVRGEFWYGNFDGRETPPSFDVYLGVHFWETVLPVEFSRLEIIAVSPGESMQVCLVNKGLGTPYISVLELRPLLDSMYPLVNASQALVIRGYRTDHGINGSTRYPQDPYDRIWFAPQEIVDWLPFSTDQTIKDEVSDFMVPGSILSTAVTTRSVSESLNFTVSAIPGERIYVFMHFAELQQLRLNETREFSVYGNNSLLLPQYRPKYLSAGAIYTTESGAEGTITYSLKATGNSTLPPMINALEAYMLVQLRALPTDENDINAVRNIKDFYKLRKDWVGDTCEPQNLTWEGISCRNNGSENHRIVALNLSHAGLVGEISPYISDLSALVSLDLSNNNLTGEIPGDLIKLSKLQVLNLSNNQLNGQVPLFLEDKSRDKILSLSTDGNKNLCSKVNSCKGEERTKKKVKSVIVPIAVTVGAVIVVLVVLVMLVWRIKTRKKNTHEGGPQETLGNISPLQLRKPQENFHRESNQFTFAEILSITKNFETQIGKGGFGTVYHGDLRDGVEVAVKMLSNISSHGAKAFQTEAQILTRVHHKNLVSLLGYCNDQNNLALIYEFMVNGTLRKHLSDHINNCLSWITRLRIALEVAQGLDYLHSFCKPPIIHRDVKSTNILLNKNMEAKLADFGLSRIFHDNDSAYVSTIVGGTLGYLDPEYYQTSKLNEKSDVYSFGIVMLELITGKSPIIDGSKRISIVSWVQARLERADINQIVDQRLEGGYDTHYVWKYIETAMSCTSYYSIRRPSMSEVVMRLKECQAWMSSQDSNYESEGQNSAHMGPVFSYPSLNPSVR